jgi:uncharacterized protein (DUF362 family)
MDPKTALTVAIAHDPKDIDRAMGQALAEIPLEDFKDRLVAIKPNDTTATARDKTACTQADTLRAAIRFVKGLHPRKIVVTGGSGEKETDEVFRTMGYLEVIEAEGVEWFDHNQAPFVPVDLPFGPQRKVMVNPRIFEYEKLVSLSQLKVHSTATVTLSIKNMAMSYPAADFYGHPRVSQKLHPHNILQDKHAFLVGMLMRFPIDLGIIVGHPAMIGKGPLGGKAVETGLVIAGRNPVAVDSVGAFLLGFETLGVQHLRQAEQLGLGATYMPTGQEGQGGRLNIAGIPVDEAVKIFRHAAYGEAF